MAHIRQSEPDPGLGFQIEILKTLPYSLDRVAGALTLMVSVQAP